MNEIRQNLTISKKEFLNDMKVGDYFRIRNSWIRVTQENLFHVKAILVLSFKW